jgi:hypothetical protein
MTKEELKRSAQKKEENVLIPNLSIIPSVLKNSRRPPKEIIEQIEKYILSSWQEGQVLKITAGEYVPYLYSYQINTPLNLKMYEHCFSDYFNEIGYVIRFEQEYRYKSIQSDPYFIIKITSIDDEKKWKAEEEEVERQKALRERSVIKEYLNKAVIACSYVIVFVEVVRLFV